MKHKFSSMGRVAIALVLALSLTLVMAVPVLADVSESTVTPSPTTVGTTAQYTIAFTTTATLGIGGEVYIEFPSDTTVPATYETADVTIDNGAGADDISSGDISGSGNVVTITLAEGISGGSTVTVVFKTVADIVNPTTAGTTYTLDVWTSAAGDSTHVPSAEYTITAAPDTTNPTVSLTAPNGGEIWATGSVQSITWTASDDIDTKLTIKLEYYNGTGWAEITTTPYLANTSLTAYSWTVASADSTACKVRVTATDDASNEAVDESDAVFTIDDTDPAVAVVLPNGGETWVESSTHNITWTCSDTDLATNPIAIDYSTDSGTTWTSVVSATANDGTYGWTVPAVYSATCLVKVTATDDAGNTGSDESNAVFTIDDTTDPLAVTVVSPNGGESWTKGSTQSITWTGGTDAIDTATSITLEYSDDAGATWETAIATSETNDGTYSWTPLPAVGVNYLVKVTATDDAGNSAFDVSDAVFTIINPVHNATQDIRYADIQAALDAAVADDTINVAEGTYTPSTTLTIAKDGVTLQATGTVAKTIIDPSAGDPAIRITGDDVVVDGFTILTNAAMGISIEGDDAIVRDNTITNTGGESAGIDPRISATNTTISGNTLSNATFYLEGDFNTVSGNSGNTINISTSSSDNEITGNILCDISSRGIVFNGEPGTHLNNLIEGNTLSRNTRYGIHVEGAGTPTITNLTITGNTITDNGLVGILIDDGVTWGAGNTISNNNISGNLNFGISNADEGVPTETVIDAENNWWGSATGPYNLATNSTATGNAVSNNVDYTPWLTSEDVDPVDPVTSISLESGWNLISLMLIPEDSAIATVLVDLIADVTVDQVRTYQAGVWSGWGAPFDVLLTDMDAGVGFWVNMDSPDTLVVTGYELCEPAPAVPPEYSVVVGWNLIGFKFTTPGTIDGYLGDVNTNLDAIYGYVDGAYFIPAILEPGLGYWIAVTLPGTIYPDLVSPN